MNQNDSRESVCCFCKVIIVGDKRLSCMSLIHQFMFLVCFLFLWLAWNSLTEENLVLRTQWIHTVLIIITSLGLNINNNFWYYCQHAARCLVQIPKWVSFRYLILKNRIFFYKPILEKSLNFLNVTFFLNTRNQTGAYYYLPK